MTVCSAQMKRPHSSCYTGEKNSTLSQWQKTLPYPSGLRLGWELSVLTVEKPSNHSFPGLTEV